MKFLLEGVTADGSGDAVHLHEKTESTIFCWGTFGSGTVTVEMSPDGSEWFSHSDLTFTAKGITNIVLPKDCYVRGTLSGATAPNVNLQMT